VFFISLEVGILRKPTLSHLQSHLEHFPLR